jgi:hypothetical protein
VPLPELARLVSGHDALINCAGFVTDGQAFVDLVSRLVTAIEALPKPERPVCWFLAGAALLDIVPGGRQGIDLPRIRASYWPHQANYMRLCRSDLDWRLLCPGPMGSQPALGEAQLRVALDALPVRMPSYIGVLPGSLVLPIFAYRLAEMIVPYADAAALMLSHLDRGGVMSRHRVGLALPVGMRGRKSRLTEKARA